MDAHPISDSPNLPLEDRVRHLEIHLAQLWDQVWWLSLPRDRREQYIREGFRDPIEKFYREG